MKSELAQYKDAEGHIFNMTAEHAASLGYTPVKKPKAQQQAPDEGAEEKAQPQAEDKAVKAAPANKGRG